MSQVHASIRVEGAGFAPYDVVIGTGLAREPGPWLAPLLGAGRTLIITDDTVRALHGEHLAGALGEAGIAAHIISVPPGEGSKSFGQLERVLGEMAGAGLDRHDTVIALGGGVVGDLAGLAAALYMRGIAFVQVPSTLLAQVDSSVGGKTAIDLGGLKNMVGAFHQPALVLADVDLLQSLPQRERRAGWAEIIKHGLIEGGGHLDFIESVGARGIEGDGDVLAEAVARSVRLKAQIVSQDAREGSVRALLNLGHTFGHALESLVLEGGALESGALNHGEAVALGCAMAARFSAGQGLCDDEMPARIEALLRVCALPARLSDVGLDFSADALMALMQADKKNAAGRLTLILLEGAGRAVISKGVDSAVLRAFLINEGARA